MAEHNKIRVIITNKQKAVKIPTGIRMLVRRCCNAVLRLEKFEGSAEISVTFTDNEGIKALNKQYRDKDIETDVLSFPMGENGVYDTNPETGAQILGDVVISMEKARDQAELFGHSLQREVGYLTAHSVLHLLGYDHMEKLERVRMREKEELVMEQLGLPASSSYIVDDDMAINDMLVKYLRKNGYITYSAYSGTEALLFLEKQKVNLIILDLMLPGLSGEQVLAEIKKTKNVPVIGLSAKEDSKSKIFLLKNGADDYVTKPFDIEELLARIETILRRIYENQYTSNSLLCCGDLNLDTIGMEATLKNQKLPLTKNEFAILKMLMEHPQQVFTKDIIYEQLWNEALEGTENAINVHISNLRKKIAAIDNSKSYIKTVWGIGFKMDI